jgi:hypothetical protein
MERRGLRFVGFVVGAAAAATAVTVARGGHELPVYPSYYPHEIELAAVAPDQAADLLRAGKIQAYVGGDLPGPHAAPLAAVESLGAWVVVRVAARPDACAIAERAVGAVAARGGDLIVHPYPVTSFHGDYLHHADLAEAARARLAGAPGPLPAEVEIVTVEAAGLVAAATTSTNGWVGPPWLRAGWFQADRLLAGAVDDPTDRARLDALRRRLTAGDVADPVEHINLERAFVSALTGGCRVRVVGYTVKREWFSAEYSAGIENIGYDALEGLDAPMFLRTVKLKDFPWNGWLALGVNGAPAAAWNPIAGLTDRFGRLLWSGLGDPAVLPAPNDAGWVLNRIADVRASP